MPCRCRRGHSVYFRVQSSSFILFKMIVYKRKIQQNQPQYEILGWNAQRSNKTEQNQKKERKRRKHRKKNREIQLKSRISFIKTMKCRIICLQYIVMERKTHKLFTHIKHRGQPKSNLLEDAQPCIVCIPMHVY